MHILGHKEDWPNEESFLPIKEEFQTHNILMVVWNCYKVIRHVLSQLCPIPLQLHGL